MDAERRDAHVVRGLEAHAAEEPERLGAFAAYAGASAAAFLALAFAFGRWFVPLNTLVNARHTRAAYRLGSQRSGSVASALLRLRAGWSTARAGRAMSSALGSDLRRLAAGLRFRPLSPTITDSL